MYAIPSTEYSWRLAGNTQACCLHLLTVVPRTCDHHMHGKWDGNVCSVHGLWADTMSIGHVLSHCLTHGLSCGMVRNAFYMKIKKLGFRVVFTRYLDPPF
jgi:hypothetical protein